ncbi:hypothetical protein C8Q78DRAFT_430898 [Trametes maxima]|nr:hypothetical protein C8Q78DRAFT_430898 [Trametes maxima]
MFCFCSIFLPLQVYPSHLPVHGCTAFEFTFFGSSVQSRLPFCLLHRVSRPSLFIGSFARSPARMHLSTHPSVRTFIHLFNHRIWIAVCPSSPRLASPRLAC